MESRIHGDMYVRFGGRLVETYHRKVEKRCWPSLLKEVLGISPKQCFKALRFKTALKNYRANGSYDLYDELGYTDFSHFVKEAKNLANTTPSEL